MNLTRGTYNYNRIIYTAPPTALKTKICNTHNGTSSITKHAKHAFDRTEERIESTLKANMRMTLISGRLVRRHADTQHEALQVFISTTYKMH